MVLTSPEQNHLPACRGEDREVRTHVACLGVEASVVEPRKLVADTARDVHFPVHEDDRVFGPLRDDKVA